MLKLFFSIFRRNWSADISTGTMTRFHAGQWETRPMTAEERDDAMAYWAIR